MQAPTASQPVSRSPPKLRPVTRLSSLGFVVENRDSGRDNLAFAGGLHAVDAVELDVTALHLLRLFGRQFLGRLLQVLQLHFAFLALFACGIQFKTEPLVPAILSHGSPAEN